MKKMILSIVCLAAAGSVLAGPADNFKRADTDKNGFVSKAEFMSMRAGWDKKKGREVATAANEKMYNKKDADKDGKLTPAEFGVK